MTVFFAKVQEEIPYVIYVISKTSEISTVPVFVVFIDIFPWIHGLKIHSMEPICFLRFQLLSLQLKECLCFSDFCLESLFTSFTKSRQYHYKEGLS